MRHILWTDITYLRTHAQTYADLCPKHTVLRWRRHDWVSRSQQHHCRPYPLAREATIAQKCPAFTTPDTFVPRVLVHCASVPTYRLLRTIQTELFRSLWFKTPGIVTRSGRHRHCIGACACVYLYTVRTLERKSFVILAGKKLSAFVLL